MKTTTYKLRLDEEQLKRWQAAAEAAGRSLAEWIRTKCEQRPELETTADVPEQKKIAQVAERRITERPLAEETPVHRQHPKSCQCGVCAFAREAGLK